MVPGAPSVPTKAPDGTEAFQDVEAVRSEMQNRRGNLHIDAASSSFLR